MEDAERIEESERTEEPERMEDSETTEVAESSTAALAAAVETERDEFRALAQRIQADFENYKKRIIKQQTEHLERAAEELVAKLLPVLDTADLAVAHGGGEAVEQVWLALTEALAKEGLERIDPKGDAFDPTRHDAVMHEPGEGDPVVSEVLRAGYAWKGRVLRPAMVKVTG